MLEENGTYNSYDRTLRVDFHARERIFADEAFLEINLLLIVRLKFFSNCATMLLNASFVYIKTMRRFCYFNIIDRNNHPLFKFG